MNQIYHWATLEAEKFDAKTVERILHALSPWEKNNPSDTEDQHVLRYGFSALKAKTGEHTDSGVSADKLYKEIEQANFDCKQVKLLLEEVGKEFKEEVNKITSFIGDLYDYHYKMIYNLNRIFPLSKREIDAQEIIQYWERKIKSFFPRRKIHLCFT